MSPPARLHFPEQRHLSPCAPFLFAVSRLLVFCRIESSVLLVKSIKIYNWKGFSLSSWSSVFKSKSEKGFHLIGDEEDGSKAARAELLHHLVLLLHLEQKLEQKLGGIGSNIADKDFVFIIHLGDGLSIHQPRRRWHCVSQLSVKICRNYGLLFFTRDTSCQDISKENGNSLLLFQSDLVLFVLKLSRRENGDLNFLAGKGKIRCTSSM